ncbi:MAG: hypothetical protein KAH14_05570, partial [Clostridiales bacterium]|nr:hypothetical protein [Clostridiales bacterium]
KVLRNNNRFNLGVNSIKMSIEDDQENYHFIYLHKKQIGGVILSSNRIKHLFLYPEYQKLMNSVIRFLHNKAKENIDTEKGVTSLPSDTTQAEIFNELWYKTIRKLRCMIGPVSKASWEAPAGYISRNISEKGI